MLDALLIALWISTGAYAGIVGIVAWRTARGGRDFPSGTPDVALPRLAVIVAARNEEAALPRCLAALTALDYPQDRIELVVADDHSTDGTREAVRAFERVAVAAGGGLLDEPEAPLAVRYLRVPEPEGHVRGKALALHAAIASTDAEVLVFTDADCAPPATWARRLAEPFADPDVGLVCGMTVVDPGASTSAAAQALDWALLLTAAGASTEAGVPATGMGNNMAVRRDAYHATGGYPALPFSVTEDFSLFRAVADRTPFTVRFRLAPGAVVSTEPAHGLGGAYQQRRRWASGGLGGGAPIWVTYAALHLSHLLPVAALLLAPVHGLAALAVMAVSNRLTLGAANRRTGGSLSAALSPVAFALAEAFRFGYLITLPAVLAARPRISWKGRAL